ncbi:MAG TPA: DUF58 domain-containing protein [Gemmatimonadales bacterium]|jgi:uncharacterized protein (DUF58 family)|nr:DUF58 domain-containing protein [Gemmatimonadales bacterium]
MTSPTAPAALLDPVLLARIGDLALLARTVVDGFMHGLHRARRVGLSLDFAEHRPYQPGDDIRRIDWRVYGRTERFYVKEYEADTNAAVVFALDASASMDFGSGAVTKFAYARFLVASLAWLSQRQGDRVGLVTFAGDLLEVVPPSTRHLQLILHTLGRARAAGAGRLSPMLTRAARLSTRAGIAVVVSDCYEEPEQVQRGVGALRGRGHDVVLFHLLDPAERDLPGDAAATFEDAETGERLPLRPEVLRERYRAELDRHRSEIARRLAGDGADYVPLTTDQPLDLALHAYLERRLAMSRIR